MITIQNFSNFNLPFLVGNELSVESFSLTQNDNTFLLAAPRYYTFYASFIRPRLGMYRGWINGFHNIEYGVLPSLFLQKIGQGILHTVFNKPIVFNTTDINTNLHINSKPFKQSNLNDAIKEAYGYAIEGGASLLKWNRDNSNQLKLDALPMDKFFITVDSYGDIESVRCFIDTYKNTINSTTEYYLCEERFFKYDDITGKKYPMAHYSIYRTSSNMTFNQKPRPTVAWKDVPQYVQQRLQDDYGIIETDDSWTQLGDFEDLKTVCCCLLMRT